VASDGLKPSGHRHGLGDETVNQTDEFPGLYQLRIIDRSEGSDDALDAEGGQVEPMLGGHPT
jgi:hypothetical protein